MWRFSLACLCALFSLLASAEDIASAIPAPQLAAKAFVLRDAQSGQLLAASEADMAVEPASLTKVMTAYLTFEALKQKRLTLTQTLPVSEKAWKIEGSKMFIDTTMTVTVDELLHGLIIQSGNDAAVTLAEGIAGSEALFAAMMNKKAAALGMQHTHYVNATGLPDPTHLTTARDLAILANALIHDYPDQYKRLYSQKAYTFNKITQPNRNRLLFIDPSVDGMKTGHTASAGYCLIASAKREDFRLISVVLGTASDNVRAAESQKLLNYGFQFYESKKLYEAGAVITTQRVWKGKQQQVALTVSAPVFFTLPRGELAQLKAQTTVKQPLQAPIQAGQALGKIEFTLAGKPLMQVPLVAAQTVESSHLLARMLDQLRLMLQ